MSKQRVFDRDFLRDELDLPGQCIDEEIVRHSRWRVHYRGVFAHEGKHYMVNWSVGATEMQDEAPWEYQPQVTATEVEKRQVLMDKWVPVEDPRP